MLNMMHEYVRKGESFAFETTLSGRGYARWIPRWQEQSYRVKLYFLRLPNPEMAVARVRQRVLQGGHDVPEHVVRRRFHAGLRNFESIYQDLVNDWAIYDNQGNVPSPTYRGESTMTVQKQEKARVLLRFLGIRTSPALRQPCAGL